MFYNQNMEFQTLKLNDLKIEEMQILIGPNSNNINVLKELYEADIEFRSDDLYFYSTDINKFKMFSKHIDCLKTLIYNKNFIDESVIKQTYLSIINNNNLDWHNAICTYNYLNKPIKYKTYNQYVLSKKINDNDLIFSLGPAGTGKTFISVLLAYKFYKEDKIKKIILTRPAVESGESLGFLPGDLQEKVDPYLSPIYDALYDLFGEEQVTKLKEKNIIEIIPLAYMRGRTLNDSFIILDEAQNTTPGQMLMFLTRLGNRSKMIVNGDLTQIDLNQNKTKSGLSVANNTLKNIDGIGFVEFNNDDIVRNKLVKKILEKYDK